MLILPDPLAQASGRRSFLRLTAGLAGAVMLAGCGGGGGGAATGNAGGVTVVDGGSAGTPPAGPVVDTSTLSADAVLLNLALNLEYVGAQFHAYAATGAGLPGTLLTGFGQQGAVTGGRQMTFTDPLIGRYAAEVAVDKQATVLALRQQLGASAAAQPAIDLTGGTAGAFSSAARAAAIISPGAGFDPFASDGNFLLAAFLLENAVAANYRMLIANLTAAAPLDAVADNLSAAIYHGGLIRTMLVANASDNAPVAGWTTAMCAFLGGLDGSNVGDQALASAVGESSNIVDADGRPIPFTRGATQMLKTIYLSSAATPGGFLPAGANGVRV